jgi:hypothetical protein
MLQRLLLKMRRRSYPPEFPLQNPPLAAFPTPLIYLDPTALRVPRLLSLLWVQDVLDEPIAATPKHLRYIKGVGKLMTILDGGGMPEEEAEPVKT